MAKLRPETHEAVRDETTTSAAVILPLIARTHGEPSGILDVGCGPEALWLLEAARLWPEKRLVGLDLDEPRSSIAVERWDAEAGEALPLDRRLTNRIDGNGMSEEERVRWPMVLCLEVAEHLSEAAGDHLVSELCRVAEKVVWSAAIPGQGGDGHVNEQPPFYWGARFNEHGFLLSDPWRSTLWGMSGVAPWYAQNLMLASPGALTRRGEVVAGPLATIPPPHLVHPAVLRAKVDLATWWREEWTKSDAERAQVIAECERYTGEVVSELAQARAAYDELLADAGGTSGP